MAVLPEEVKNLFQSAKTVEFGTSSLSGQPNINIIGMKFVIDDETLYISDQFFLKTLKNLQENPQVSILVFNDEGAYQIYGTAEYVTDGPVFEQFAPQVNAIFEQMGRPIKTKGGCVVKVTAVYSSASGPQAGAQIA